MRISSLLLMFFLLHALQRPVLAEVVAGLREGDTQSVCVGFHPTALHGVRAGCVETIVRAGQVSNMQYNSKGLRDREYSPRPKRGHIRVLFLGPSLLVGPGLAVDETPPKVLESIFRSRRRALEVINAGVEGYSALNFAAVIVDLVRAYSPTHVVLFLNFGTSSNADLMNEIFVKWSGHGGPHLELEVSPFGRLIAKLRGWQLHQWNKLRKVITMQSAWHRIVRTLGCQLRHPFDSSLRTNCLMEISIRAIAYIKKASEAAGARFSFFTSETSVLNVPIVGPGRDMEIARGFDMFTPSVFLYPAAPIRRLRAEGVHVEVINLANDNLGRLPGDYHLNAHGARSFAEALAPLLENTL